MKSAVVNRSVVIGGRKTTVSLEDAFWDGLEEIAKSRNVTISHLLSSINMGRRRGTLSSAIRLCVLGYYKGAAQQRRCNRETASIGDLFQ
ncbi:MAG: ribbon-helix-helix domain-containing protein [Pseudolabrys sp.]|jgi:predicted DNA-binding ribbon-helix-helix protein